MLMITGGAATMPAQAGITSAHDWRQTRRPCLVGR
jgi:hypothetical protein